MQYTSRPVYEYVSTATNDPIIEWKICAVSWVEFPIYQSDLDFYTKISPSFAGEKLQIPTPKLCPEERQRRRLSFRNERKLYKRRCDATWEQIISIYSPDKLYKIYNQQYRWSDARDAIDYGFEFDFSKTFRENFDALNMKTPKVNLINDNVSENSSYVNQTTNMNNSYLCYDADYCNNCLYSNIIKQSSNCADCTNVYSCKECYSCIDCTNSYHLTNCEECDNSSFLEWCVACSNCQYCINSSNLVGKKYYINNKAVTQDAYEEYLVIYQKSYCTQNKISRNQYLVNTSNSIGNNLRECDGCIFSHNQYCPRKKLTHKK